MGIKVSYPTRLILLLLMNMIKDSQITQSNKFAISLQRLKKEVWNGGRFGHAVGIILFGGSGQRSNHIRCYLFYGGPIIFVVTCFL